MHHRRRSVRGGRERANFGGHVGQRTMLQEEGHAGCGAVVAAANRTLGSGDVDRDHIHRIKFLLERR